MKPTCFKFHILQIASIILSRLLNWYRKTICVHKKHIWLLAIGFTVHVCITVDVNTV